MDEGPDQEPQVPPGQRHIIRRPRLERLLDESKARIIMLVAPAGYGKTTLARQWLEHSGAPSIFWYRATPASSDVAALSVGVAEVARNVLPTAGVRLASMLKAQRRDTAMADDLAEVLAEDFSAWRGDAWLVLDDYQFLSPSPEAERFIERIVDLTGLQVLITSRVRPKWATARRMLYGEIVELGHPVLAMDQNEAAQALPGVRDETVRGLLALAEGWPAIIGLAALAGDIPRIGDDLPATLYDFFADEVYRRVDAPTQHALCELAVAPHISGDLAEHVLGENARGVLDEGTRMGFFRRTTRVDYDLHPLLRTFLRTKLREESGHRESVRQVGAYLLARGNWDDAASIATEFDEPALLVHVAETALAKLVATGRFASMENWLAYGRQQRIDAPIFDLLEAEIALCEGLHPKAERLALSAAGRLALGHSLRSRAFFVAGQAAFLSGSAEVASGRFALAKETAVDADATHQALWGEFIVSMETEDAHAGALLDEFEGLATTRADDLLRLLTGRLLLGAREGDLDEAVRQARGHRSLVPRAEDPFIRSSFLSAYAGSLALTAQYEESLVANDEALSYVEEWRLPFAVPFIQVSRTQALMGLRRLDEAEDFAASVGRAARSSGDAYLTLHSKVLLARCQLARKLPESAAITLAQDSSYRGALSMYAEYRALHGFVLALLGRPSEALEAVDQSLLMSQTRETRLMALCAKALIAARDDIAHAREIAAAAVCESASSGIYDPIVCAYRASPLLLELFAASRTAGGHVARLLALLGDEATRFEAAWIDRPSGQLSPREHEVLLLIGEGLSNRRIAQTLFISESTVKVHVRHIFEKLNVRTRTEAALRASMTNSS